MEPADDPAFGRVNRLLNLTIGEDERGLVLKLCSFAEEALGRLLLGYLRPGKSSTDLIEGFNAPLGTFSSRIKAAFAVGLLSEEQARDLDTARKIRNEFAHNWEGCSFETQSVREWTRSLSPSRISDHEPRDDGERFRACLTCILIELSSLDHEVRSKNRTVLLIARHLSNKPPVASRRPPTP